MPARSRSTATRSTTSSRCGRDHVDFNHAQTVIAFRAPALPAQSTSGGEVRKGGDAPLRAERRQGVELSMWQSIREKAEGGKRLDRADGLWLLTEAPLLELGALAQETR